MMMMMMIGDVELQFGDGRDRVEGKEDTEEIFGGRVAIEQKSRW